MSTTTENAPRPISADRLRELLDAGESFTLIDTRDAESFDGWRLSEAQQYRHVPDGGFDAEAFRETTDLEETDPVVTICAKGKSSRYLAEEMAEAGYADVRYVEGGMKAWSAVYDRVEVSTPGSAEIVQIQRRAKGCLGYLIGHDGAAIAVDTTRHVEVFRRVADERGWTIERVLDTHVHADHISGGRTLAERLDVPYHLGERAADRNVTYEYEPLGRNETVTVGGLDVKAVSTPGHTSEAVSYLIGREALLTGDTAFVDGVGRTELQFGEADAAAGAELLYESLHGTVLAEPDPIVVLPGHFSVTEHGEYGVTPGEPAATTVGGLRTGLDILATDRETFVDRIADDVPEKPPNYERIIAINRGATEPADESEAVELELGPNRCAAE